MVDIDKLLYSRILGVHIYFFILVLTLVVPKAYTDKDVAHLLHAAG